MTLRLMALPRRGPRAAGALPLAGSATLWFDQASRVAPGRIGAAVPVSDDAAQRLSVPRPVLCGLSLDQPRILGILNLTPDSFSDGGDLPTLSAVVARARAMACSADILDIGGESTRPGAAEVPVAEEIARTAPAIAAIRAAGITTPISIDTRKAAVARAALAEGADMVNDVSALGFDPAMAEVVAEARVPVCLMHALGTPATMQADPTYDDVLCDVFDALSARVSAALGSGIAPDRIVLDPGIGFGKTLQHNLILLRHLSLYHDLGFPLLLGASRKRFIGSIGGAEAARDRLAGSLAVALHGAAQGAHVLRVHDTVETRQALRLQQALDGV